MRMQGARSIGVVDGTARREVNPRGSDGGDGLIEQDETDHPLIQQPGYALECRADKGRARLAL